MALVPGTKDGGVRSLGSRTGEVSIGLMMFALRFVVLLLGTRRGMR